MFHRTAFHRVLLALVFTVISSSSVYAASSEPYYGTEIPNEMHRGLVVGCRLGAGTGALPTYLAPDYSASGALDKLDVTLTNGGVTPICCTSS
jgi:hypothetical protein